MSGDLFQYAPLAVAQRPPRADDDTLVGPYARQLLGDCRLKFWFALVHGDGRARHRRYELLFTKGESAARYRVRGDSDDTSFRDYAIPEDLSPFPALTFAGIVVPADTPNDPVSLAVLMDEYSAAMAHNSGIDAKLRERNAGLFTIEQTRKRIDERAAQIADLKQRIADLQNANASDEAAIEAATSGLPAVPVVEKVDLTEIQERISSSEATNHNVGLWRHPRRPSHAGRHGRAGGEG